MARSLRLRTTCPFGAFVRHGVARLAAADGRDAALALVAAAWAISAHHLVDRLGVRRPVAIGMLVATVAIVLLVLGAEALDSLAAGGPLFAIFCLGHPSYRLRRPTGATD